MDGVSESAAFLDSNGGAGRQHLGRDRLRGYWAFRIGSRRGAAHGPAPEPVEEALGVDCYGSTHQQIAYPNGTKSNALSCYGRRACCWLEAMACVSSWTGGLQTREPQLALSPKALNACSSLSWTALRRSTYLGHRKGAG